MLPKATLLGDQGDTYLFRHGTAAYSFRGGVPEDVPVGVAMLLRKKKNVSGAPQFKVEGLPSVVEREQKADVDIPIVRGEVRKIEPPIKEEEQSSGMVTTVEPVVPAVFEQDVYDEEMPRQLRLVS